MAFAISRVIEKVVVVVVVTMRVGSLGSGPRLDWENLRFARLRAASSLRKMGRSEVEYERGREERKTDVRKELGKLRKNCLFVVSSRETTSVAKRSSVSCGVVDMG